MIVRALSSALRRPVVARYAVHSTHASPLICSIREAKEEVEADIFGFSDNHT